MKIIIGCSLILALSFIVASGYADDLQDGVDAYNRKDYKTAFEMLKPLAEQGNAMAQIRLGWMYKKGRGTPKDSKKAAELYRNAADNGYSKARYKLNLLSRLKSVYFFSFSMIIDLIAFSALQIIFVRGDKKAPPIGGFSYCPGNRRQGCRLGVKKS